MRSARIVAITGGTGFIGTELVRACLSEGCQVRVLSRNPDVSNGSVDWFQGDLMDSHFVPSAFLDNVDILYNCAAEIKDESKMFELHVTATQKLVSFAEGKIKRWVQLSSVGAYGDIGDFEVDETTSENPRGIYEISKTKADQIVMSSSIPSVVVRPSNVFGSSMSNQSLKQLVLSLDKGWFFYFGNRKALMKYVHVCDVVEALILCGKHKSAIGKTFIVSDTLILEGFVQAVCRARGVKTPKIDLPLPLVKIFVKLLEKLPKFPLSSTRLKSLSAHGSYSARNIKKDLGFSFAKTLEQRVMHYAKELKK